MGACASADSGLSGPLLEGAEAVAFIAVSRWQQRKLAAAFHAWWELWAQRRRPRGADGSLYTFAQRRRLRHAFHTWARPQIAQKRAWEHFREGAGDLPPPPLAEDDEELRDQLRRNGTGWRPAGTLQGPAPPTPRWMDSWGDAKQRVEAMEQHNKVAATRRRRLERAQNQRRWASAEAALVSAGSPSGRVVDEALASRALTWVDSLLPQGGDALAGEWRAVGQYTDASNLQVKVAESFMVVEDAHGQRYGYPLPPVGGGGWQGRGGDEGEGVAREYLMQDFRIADERAEWTQLFRDGNATQWSCLLAPDPGAPGGFCMRAGSWRDLTGSGAHMGSFTATAGPRGRGSLGVEEHWGAEATEEILALHDELARFRGQHHSGERFDDALADGRGGSARTRRQRELWDLDSSSDEEEDDSDREVTMRLTLTRADNKPSRSSPTRGSSPRSPEARILSKAARGWQRGELEEVEHSPRTELRALEAVARECFDLFARDADDSSPSRRRRSGGGITADRYVDIESGVHARLGLRAGVAGWAEYWRFVKRQMSEHSQTPEEMRNYLLAVKSELKGDLEEEEDLAWEETKALLAVYEFSDGEDEEDTDEGEYIGSRSRSRDRSPRRSRTSSRSSRSSGSSRPTRSRSRDGSLSLAERRQGRGLPVRSMSSASSRGRMRAGITPRLGR